MSIIRGKIIWDRSEIILLFIWEQKGELCPEPWEFLVIP